MRFLPWHFEFFCRYRPLSAEKFVAASKAHPLIQTRFDEQGEELSVLERLLRDPREEVHLRLAELLWSAGDLDAAEAAALQLAAEMPPVAGERDPLGFALGESRGRQGDAAEEIGGAGALLGPAVEQIELLLHGEEGTDLLEEGLEILWGEALIGRAFQATAALDQLLEQG